MRNRSKRGQQGFSLLELMTVLVVTFIVTGMAIYSFSGSFQTFNVNSSMASVASELRAARQTAISKRRNVQVFIDQTFVVDNRQHVSYQIQPQGGEKAFPIDQSGELTRNTKFLIFGAIPDTPMKFGKSSAVYIGGVSGGPPAGMFFNSSGAFVDTSNSPIDGTLFIGQANQPSTARAVTILGSTGRVRTYTWDGTQWREQ